MLITFYITNLRNSANHAIRYTSCICISEYIGNRQTWIRFNV